MATVINKSDKVMKSIRLLSVWLLSFICMLVSAQTAQLEYRPFVQDGKLWRLRVGEIMENIYGNMIDGDTLIGGERWNKVYNYVGVTSNNKYYAAIRESGKKVYAIAKGSSRTRLLYDFGLKEGQTVKCGIEGNAFGCLLDEGEKFDTLLGFPLVTYLKVERIDTVTARGLQHRRFTLSILDSFKEYLLNEWEPVVGSVTWIEGVGSGAGPFSPWMPLPPNGSILVGCKINKTDIFGYSDFYDAEIYNSVGGIRSDESEESGTYDLSGRRLSAPPAKGMYIEDKRVKIKE